MADTSAKLEKFFNQLEDMDLPKSFKNEVGRVARQEGIDSAEALLSMSLERSGAPEYIGPKPKRKPPAPKMLGGRIYASRKPKSL